MIVTGAMVFGSNKNVKYDQRKITFKLTELVGCFPKQ